MLCILRAMGLATIGLTGGGLGTGTAVAAVTSPQAAVVSPVSDADWLPAAEGAGRPVVDAEVPLPTGTAGSLACIALVVGLRLTRHRHWVTLR